MYLALPDRMRLVVGPQPERERTFADELTNYLVTNFEGDVKGKRKVELRLRGLFGAWGGGFFSSDGVFVVYLPTALEGDALVEVRERYKVALSSWYSTTTLGHGPARPSLGKWTPVGMCLDWWMLAIFGNMITH